MGVRPSAKGLATASVLLMLVARTALYLARENTPPASEGGPERQQVPAWGETSTLAEATALGVPAVAYDPVAGTVAAWPRDGHLEVRVRPPGGSWGSPEAIRGGSGPNLAQSAMVATDGAGTVTVAWVRGDRLRMQLVAATRSRTSQWQVAVLWDVAGARELDESPVRDPHLSVGPDGSAAVAWTHVALTDPRDPDTTVRQGRAAYRPAGGDWGPAARLGATDSVERRSSGDDRSCRKRDGGWAASALPSDDRSTTQVASVVYPDCSASVFWSDGRRILTRSQGKPQ